MPIRERAARRGHTWNPWPCCNAEVDQSEWYWGRPKKEHLCKDCTELIKLGKDARERSLASGETTYKWVERYHDWPGYHGAYYFEHRPGTPIGEPHNAGDELRLRMFELVNALGKTAPGQAWRTKAKAVLTCDDTSRRISRYEVTRLLTMDSRVREALDAYDNAVRKALESAYAAGKKYGQNILLNLAGNELSINDFNRRTAEKTK